MALETDIQRYFDFYAAAREFLATTPIETSQYESEARAVKAYENLLLIPEELRTKNMWEDISKLKKFIDKKRSQSLSELIDVMDW